MHKIDWKYLTESYNNVYKTNYSERQMLKTLYKKTGSSYKMSKILGVTALVIRDRLRKHGIQILPRGGIRKKLLDGVRVSGRTAKEVAKEIGCARITVYKWAYTHGIKLKQEREKACM